MRIILKSGAAALLAISATAHGAVPEEVIQDSFYPYRDSVPSHPGFTPGMRVTADNVDALEDILDPFTFRYVKQGWYEFDTTETFPITLHPNYIQATRDYGDQVTLDGNGVIQNFRAGRPFPQEPDTSDTDAGTKLIWNFQRSINAGDSETIQPFWWSFRNANNGKTERTLKFEWHFLNWKHRTIFEPENIEPNPGDIFRSIYGTVLEPFDLANTQLLIQRYEDDLKRDDGWLYLGFQRRVRRLASGQITDAFLGSDAMIEDFEGYNGRISDYNWEYVRTMNMLMPYEKHNEQKVLDDEPANDKDGFRFVKFGGQGNCFPEVTWQLRKTHVIKGTPKDPSHPLSQRLIFQDAETSTLAVVVLYDKKGDPWKYFPICKTHPDHHLTGNKGSGVAIDDCAVFFDEQAMHCTTLQFKSYINAEENPPTIFNVQNMRKRGR
jgi:hypothetical protein